MKCDKCNGEISITGSMAIEEAVNIAIRGGWQIVSLRSRAIAFCPACWEIIVREVPAFEALFMAIEGSNMDAKGWTPKEIIRFKENESGLEGTDNLKIHKIEYNDLPFEAKIVFSKILRHGGELDIVLCAICLGSILSLKADGEKTSLPKSSFEIDYTGEKNVVRIVIPVEQEHNVFCHLLLEVVVRKY